MNKLFDLVLVFRNHVSLGFYLTPFCIISISFSNHKILRTLCWWQNVIAITVNLVFFKA